MHRLGFTVRVIVALTFVFVFVSTAIAAPAGDSLFGYGVIFDNDTAVYNFVGFAPLMTIAPLDVQLRAGTFIGGDYSTEYAVDADANLVSIDVATGAVTSAGTLNVGSVDRASLGADPSSGLLYGIFGDSNCAQTLLYAIDPVSAAATLIGVLPECVESVAYDPGGSLYILDLSASALNVVDPLGNETTLGPLGIALNPSARIVFDPASGALYLIQFDFFATNDLYAVNVDTGAATFVGPIGGENPMGAPVLALRPVIDDTIFADGFDPPAGD